MSKQTKNKATIVYAKDIAGLWLYIQDGGNMRLVTPMPIIDPDVQQLLMDICKDARPLLEGGG